MYRRSYFIRATSANNQVGLHRSTRDYVSGGLRTTTANDSSLSKNAVRVGSRTTIVEMRKVAGPESRLAINNRQANQSIAKSNRK